MLINNTSQRPLFVQWWHTHWNYYYNVLKNNVEFNFKSQAKKQRFLKLCQKFPEEKQQLLEEKDADDLRKVLLLVNHSFSGFEN